MKNNKVMGYAALGIAFALVSVIVFVLPTQKTAAFGTAYAFTVLAFAAQIIIWRTAFAGVVKSKFLGISLVQVGIGYLVAQLVALAVFTAAPMLPVWAAVVACAVILVAAALCLIGSNAARSHVEQAEERVQSKTAFIKGLQTDIKLLADEEQNAETKQQLKKLAEAVRYSDPMSAPELEDLEVQIAEKVAALKKASDKGALIAEITALLNERNKKCKILK